MTTQNEVGTGKTASELHLHPNSKDKANLPQSLNPNEDLTNNQTEENPEIVSVIKETKLTEEAENNPTSKPKSKKRCHQCNKKLSLVMQSCGMCKCGGSYCSHHRFPREHNCQYDFRAEGQEELRRRNPRVVADQLNRI